MAWAMCAGLWRIEEVQLFGRGSVVDLGFPSAGWACRAVWARQQFGQEDAAIGFESAFEHAAEDRDLLI